MAIILLDSSVIFYHLNGRFGRTEYLEGLLEQGHVLARCPVNFTEVYAGLREGEEDKTAAFLNSLEYLPVTPGIARQAGLLRRDWRKKGQTLSYADVTIAAVALSGEIGLLTDNRKHFPMPELEILPLPEVPAGGRDALRYQITPRFRSSASICAADSKRTASIPCARAPSTYAAMSSVKKHSSGRHPAASIARR
jgi:predicted nucleic acid-binding protein